MNLVPPLRRVCVTGGRDYTDHDRVEAVLHVLLTERDEVTQGGARGADLLAKMVALEMGCLVVTMPALWDEHGKAAGVIRNQQMLERGIDLLIAFPGGRGTADMVRRCKAAGVEVVKAMDVA